MLEEIKSQILKKEDATRYRSACMRLSYLAQNRLDLAETAKHLAQRKSVPREFDLIPLKRAARYLVGKPRAALRFRRQEHVEKITVFVDSDFASDPRVSAMIVVKTCSALVVSLKKEHDTTF